MELRSLNVSSNFSPFHCSVFNRPGLSGFRYPHIVSSPWPDSGTEGVNYRVGLITTTTYGEDQIDLSSSSIATHASEHSRAHEALQSTQTDTNQRDQPLSEFVGLSYRFVSEMLSTLAAAGLVQLEAGTGGKDGQTTRFHVPPEHREDLTKAAVCCLSISYNARHFEDVRKCFDLDGPSGLHFESEHDHSIIDQWGEVFRDSTMEAILKTPGLRQRLEDGIEVAEVGCGSGRISRRLAVMFPKTRFIATDIDSHPLECGKKMAQEEREKSKASGGGDQLTDNITFQLLDISKDIPSDLQDKFDWLLASEMLHHIPDKPTALRNVRQLLKPGGQFTVIDEIGVSSYVAQNVGNQQAAALYAMSTMMPGCVQESVDPKDEGSFCWGEEKARETLASAGFRVLGVTKSEDLGASAVCMCQKPE